MNRILFAIFSAVLLLGASSPQPTAPSKDSRNKNLLRQTRMPWGAIHEVTDNLAWSDLQAIGFEYTISFDEGASKGMQLIEFDGTAFSSTAAALNRIYYGRYSLSQTGVAVPSGNASPTANADGLDITGAAVNNSNLAYFGGVHGASGRPMVIGTDPSAEFCVTTTITDVSGSDSYFIGWRTADAPVALSSYSDYCGFNIISGDINVTDVTTGDTDTTDNWADLAEKTMCVKIDTAGACTYTNDGSAPSTTDAHTLGDGLLVIPALQILLDADLAEDTIVSTWAVDFQ